MPRVLSAFVLFLTLAATAAAQSESPVSYVVTFPAPEHHWLQVEATFRNLGAAPLRARMSRSSPGRYAVHEFAKNVFWVEAYDGANRARPIARPDADEWRVEGHDGTVRLVYRIFGDHADGTYMGVDTTHAHLNMPATFMWALGLEMRPIQIRFVPPAASGWKAATQLFPTSAPFEFTAPNLQYFMDSPIELSNFISASFEMQTGNSRTAKFRVVVHGDASQGEVDELAKLVQRLVREESAVFGELPEFETGQYTFLFDLVPWAYTDSMEHRNSTSIAAAGLSLRSAQQREQALSWVAHEFFHVWNVERVRPAGLEPFDFTRENVTCCLWLAEGFTQYYEELLMVRAGFGREPPVGYAVAAINGPGRQVRSLVQMSEQAPFTDDAVANDVTDHSRTFVSYYTYGAAVALALDLALRDLTQNRVSLDDYMRRLWTTYGKATDPRPGYVARPYSLQDLRRELAELTNNKPFADQFFDKYVEGRDAADYARLLPLAGYHVQLSAAGRGWIGNVSLTESAGGLLVGGQSGSLVPFETPLYEAGVDAGDVIVSIDQRPATMAAYVAIGARRPGDRVNIAVRRRDGNVIATVVTVKSDPQVQIVPANLSGGALTSAQQAFRRSWLGTKGN